MVEQNVEIDSILPSNQEQKEEENEEIENKEIEEIVIMEEEEVEKKEEKKEFCKKEKRNMIEKKPFSLKRIYLEFEKRILKNQKLLTFLILNVNLLCGILFGFHIGISGPILFPLSSAFEEVGLYDITGREIYKGLFLTFYYFGFAFGPFLGLLLVYLIGFKLSFIICLIILFIGEIIGIFSIFYFMLLITRSIVGISTGILSFIGPIYSSSILTQIKFKSLVNSIYFIGFGFGILFSNLTVFFTLIFYSWNFMLSISIIFQSYFFLISLIVPESPELRNPIEINKSPSIFSKLKLLFFSFKNIKKIFICFLLILNYQFGGILCSINFLPQVLEKMGLVSFYPRAISSIGICLFNLIIIFLFSFIIDRVGRKKYLFIGSIFSFIGNLSSGFVTYFVTKPLQGYISIPLICLIIFGNVIGIHTLIFYIFNEIFDFEMSNFASAFMLSSLHLLQILLNFSFLPLIYSFHLPSMFWVFAGVTLIISPLILLLCPETNTFRKIEVNTSEDESFKEEVFDKDDSIVELDSNSI
eukprot:gene8517-341_t